jgi:hypothetical protein
MLHARAIALRADTPAVATVLHVALARRVRATARRAAVIPAVAPEVVEAVAVIVVAVEARVVVEAEAVPEVAEAGGTPADMGANQRSFT